MFLLRIFTIAFLLLGASAAYAQNAPVPPDKKKEIGALDEKLKEQTEQKKAMEAELKQIESELTSTKGDLVSTAKSIQESEKQLQGFDDRIAKLEKEQEVMEEKLLADRGSIANLVLALGRLRRMPPEAMITRPDAPLKTAQSAMLLRDILPVLQKQADELKVNLASLERTTTELQEQRAQALATSETLKAEQNKLTELVDKRTQLYAGTHEDYKAQTRKVEQIATQSKNLADLVKKLESERAAQAKKEQEEKKVQQAQKLQEPQPRRFVESTPRMGSARLPISGVVTTRFQEPDNFGAPSQGVEIEGRSGSLVVAPMGGVIRFAGFFKNYGNMVIVEHEKGWHSLIAGLEKIDTVVGQSVNAGEPLGLLHKSSTGEHPVLYYELRQNGKAVNPAKKFADLS